MVTYKMVMPIHLFIHACWEVKYSWQFAKDIPCQVPPGNIIFNLPANFCMGDSMLGSWLLFVA